MDAEQLEQRRYPVGRLTLPAQSNEAEREEWIDTIASFPGRLRALVERLDDEALARTYRPDGWNVRQLVHHCADSHMNAFVRYKLALTEDQPNIKPYAENLWAELPDTVEAPIEHSLNLLDGLHARWTVLIQNIHSLDWERVYIHPEYKKTYRLDQVLALYAWHCRHHLGHVKLAIQ